MSSTTHSPQHRRSILSLDKSDAPFSKLIDEACHFLNIQLEEEGITLLCHKQDPKRQVGSDPRVDWALRWLLKNLQTVEVRSGSICLEYRAWLLLRELVLRTPLTTVARLFSAHKFTTTIQATLQWFAERCLSIDELHDCHTETNSIDSSLDGSSSTLREASPTDAPRISKKRKRDGTPQSSLPRTYTDIARLYTSICCNFIQLEEIAQDDSLGYAVEHLKAALKIAPENAAVILGCSAKIVDYLLRNRLDNSTMENDDAWILPLIQYWQSNSTRAAEDINLPTNTLFSKHCLVPILNLVKLYDDWEAAGNGKQHISNLLDDLLLTQILRPVRSSHQNSLLPLDARNPDIPAYLSGNLLAPLFNNFVNEGNVQFDALESAATLYNVAARNSKQLSPKERKIETKWLQHLFYEIAESAKIFDYEELEHREQDTLIHFCTVMLDVIIQSKIILEPATLEKILQPLFRIRRVFTITEWSLISLCMELEASVFVAPLGRHLVHKEQARKVPNHLLSSLLGRISEIGFMSTSIDVKPHLRSLSDTICNSLIPTVLTPLAKSFVQGRDFPTFLTIWQDQLCQHYLNGPDQTMSIWEEDEFLHSVEQLIETATTVGLMEKTLHSLQETLEYHVELLNNEARELQKITALLVVLECLLLGCKSHQNPRVLEDWVVQMYKILLKLVTDDKKRCKKLNTRCWRVLAAISDRWPIPDQPFLLEQDAIRAAASVIDTACRLEFLHYDYSQELQAFRFLLSLAQVEKTRLDGLLAGNPDDQTQSLIANTLEKILDHSADRESHESSAYSDKWNGQDDFITRGSEFGLACCAQLVCIPQSLSLLGNSALQYRVFNHLYSRAFAELSKVLTQRDTSIVTYGAITESFVPEIDKTSRVTYLKLWDSLSRSPLLEDEVSVSACFRNFQVAQYLQNNPNSSTEPSSKVRARTHDIALSLLTMTPLQLFTKTQKTDLFNRLLQVLVNRCMGDNAIAEALHLLAYFMRTPNTSMAVLEKAGIGLGDNQSASSTTWMFETAAWLDEIGQEAGPDIPAIIQLKHVAVKVLEYLCFTTSQNSRVECLLTLYRKVGELVANGLTDPDRVATSNLVESCLGFYFQHRERLPDPLKERWRPMDVWRSTFIESTVQATTKSAQRPSNHVSARSVRGLLLDITHSQAKMVLDGPDVDVTSTLTQLHPTSLSAVADYSEGILKAQVFRAGHCDESEDQSLVDDACQILQSLELPKEKTFLLNTFQSLLRQRDRLHILQIISDMLLEGSEARDVHEQERDSREFCSLRLLERALVNVENSSQSSDPVASRLAQTFTVLCDLLCKTFDNLASIQAIRCLGLLLRHQKCIISQFHIDRIMSVIAVKSTALNCQVDQYRLGTVFLGLCRLFEWTLSMHRKKLGGRYHLVIRSLQCLLQCLFVPYKDLEGSAITAEDQMSYAEYGEAQAAAYARLLTMICDPTVSAVSKSRRTSRQELNDETQKARRIAGQHLQYVVEEFCNCQLEGRLLPEMRVALNPGLWAIFDVMSQGVMRNLNAGMDSSSRSVFKALYDEYRRSGPWRNRSGVA